MKLKAIVVAMSVAVVLSSGAAQAAPSYSVTAFSDNPDGGSNYASGINNSGQIVGWSHVVVNNTAHAFLYSDGGITDLGTLGGQYSYANDINESGQIVGLATLAGDTYTERAFLYSDGGMTDLGTLGGKHSYATAINDSGQIVGSSIVVNTHPRGAGPEHAFLYSDGRMTDLGTLGAGSYNSYASDINNSGQVVGSIQLYGGIFHAFLYSSEGGMIDLAPNGNQSVANAINDSGQIVGYSYLADAPYNSQAFLYSDGSMTDLGTLGGSGSLAYDINESGQIVGMYYPEGSPYTSHGFLYSDGVMTDLNSLVLSGWTIQTALGINNSGQIIANGWHYTLGYGSLLLTPGLVPEPSTYAMLLAGLGLVGGQAWRRNNRAAKKAVA